jgi:predicted TIM-barrel fold metal-dependent hydrolase
MPVFDSFAELEGSAIPGVNQNHQQIMSMMQTRGIDRTLLVATRAARVDPVSGNRILKAMLDQGQGLYGCLVAHTNRVEPSLQAIRDLAGSKKILGVMLVGTDPEMPLHPLVADEILNACRRFQKPIFIPTPNAACVDIALHLTKTYNMHKFVFVGMGGNDWRTAIAAAHQSVNIFLETSGPLDRAKLPAAVEGIGSHRILFGSGSPHRDPIAALGLLEDSLLSATDKRRIVFENAARLFALDQIEA